MQLQFPALWDRMAEALKSLSALYGLLLATKKKQKRKNLISVLTGKKILN